jgi:hypothetical protein
VPGYPGSGHSYRNPQWRLSALRFGIDNLLRFGVTLPSLLADKATAELTS